MPIFVHLTSERSGRRMKRSGIKCLRGVYCLPVLPNYYVSHQWLRELKRRGHRVIVGVYFALPDDDVVQHLATTLGRYREPAAREMLITLCRHASDDVRESAADSLLDLYKGGALNILAPLLPDEAIARAIAEHNT